MAEDIILWENATFTGPFTNGVITSSAEIPNNNDLNSAKVTIQYEAISPDGANQLVGFAIQAVLEEEVSTGVWVPIATQDDLIKGTDEAMTQVIEFAPQLVENPGTPEKLISGSKEIVSISRHNGRAPNKMRICLFQIVLDDTRPLLDSVTVSGYLRKFNK